MGSQSFSIRRATVADAAIIAAHRRAMFEDMRHGSPEQLDAMDARFREWIADKLARGEYLGWLVTDDQGSIVAGAGLWIAEWPAHPLDQSGKRGVILNVYTRPACRRLGLARRLMATILDHCREYGVRFIALNASDEGRALYESLGFRQTNEMRLLLPDSRENG